MPSLNVPLVARMNSSSSICSSLLNSWMIGMVASPTPTMPISSDSTSVILSRSVGNRDRRAFFPEVVVGTPGETIMCDEEITDSLVFVGSQAVIFIDRDGVETATLEIVDESHRRRLDQLDAR